MLCLIDTPPLNLHLFCRQLIGGVLGIAIAWVLITSSNPNYIWLLTIVIPSSRQTIFGNALTASLIKFAPDAPFALVRSSVDSIAGLSDSVRPGVIHAYTDALRQVSSKITHPPLSSFPSATAEAACQSWATDASYLSFSSLVNCEYSRV